MEEDDTQPRPCRARRELPAEDGRHHRGANHPRQDRIGENPGHGPSPITVSAIALISSPPNFNRSSTRGLRPSFLLVPIRCSMSITGTLCSRNSERESSGGTVVIVNAPGGSNDVCLRSSSSN